MATPSPSKQPPAPLSDSVSTSGSESSTDFETPRQATVSLSTGKGRRSRSNTVEEKRRLRKDRIKRKRRYNRLAKFEDQVCRLQSELRAESSLKVKAELNVIAFKNRARTFWERWRWEVEKRREAIRDLQLTQLKTKLPHKCSCNSFMQEVDPSMLNDPIISGKQEEHYVGRGSFGVVKVQVFRDILVAVKEYLPKSLKLDVVHEASLLSKVCHPYLPLLIGICTNQKPLRIVIQFHAFNELESKTMQMELLNNSLTSELWLRLCAYLHVEVNILHNDIELNNILIAKSGGDTSQCQAVLINFGKSTLANESR